MTAVNRTSTDGHSYGSTTVSGTGTTILGDNHRYGDNIQVANATFVLEDISVLIPQLVKLLKHSSGRNYVDNGRQEYRIRTLHAGSGAHNSVQEIAPLSARRAALDNATWQQLAGLVRNKLWLALGIQKPSQRNTFVHEPPNNWEALRQSNMMSSGTVAVSERLGAVYQKAELPFKEVLAVLTLLCALLTRRAASRVAVIEAYIKLQRHSMFPYFTAAVAAWISSIIHRTYLRVQPSELTGDCITFVDAYDNSREVPLAYLADVYILKGFFKSHYEGSTAERLVDGRRYILAVHHRYGPEMSISKICHARSRDTIAGSTFYMAIMYRAGRHRCIDCTNNLSRIYRPSDDFSPHYCPYCRRAYGISKRPNFNTSSFVLPSWHMPDALGFGTGLGGIRNINLDIVTRLRSKDGRSVIAWTEYQHRPYERPDRRKLQTETDHPSQDVRHRARKRDARLVKAAPSQSPQSSLVRAFALLEKAREKRARVQKVPAYRSDKYQRPPRYSSTSESSDEDVY